MFDVSLGELVTSDWRGCVAFTGVVESISLSFKVSQFNSVPPAAFQALYVSINCRSKRDTEYLLLSNGYVPVVSKRNKNNNLVPSPKKRFMREGTKLPNEWTISDVHLIWNKSSLLVKSCHFSAL